MLLTDVAMPGMSGPDLVERIKPLRPTIAVVYMSGYTDDAIGQHGLLDAGTHFLQKPFTARDLLTKCREGLAPGSAEGPGLRPATLPGEAAAESRPAGWTDHLRASCDPHIV